jgi:hypothetical protein
LLLSHHDTNPGHVVDNQKRATFCQTFVHLYRRKYRCQVKKLIESKIDRPVVSHHSEITTMTLW